jgi:uncharacterized protein (TIGR03067 family)
MRSTIILVLCMAFLSVSHAFSTDAGEKDIDKLQGDWALASCVIDGTKLSDDEAQSLFRTVKGDQYTVLLFDKVITKGTFKIDPKKNPRTIDSYPAGASDKAILGIYELHRDTLKICSSPPGKERPTAFESKKNSGYSLMIWEREKK